MSSSPAEMGEIHWEDLSFSYIEESGYKVLDGIELRVYSERFTLLTGSSGRGKSTLLYLAAGIYPGNGGVISSGRVTVNGKDPDKLPPEERAALVGMIFQNPDLQFCMDTVEHELIFCLENLAVPVEQMDARIDRALEFCGISHLKKRRLDSLSGGEKQKAMLACAVVIRPRWLLLDEPFANLDEVSARELALKLRRLHDEEGVGIVAVDHDPWMWDQVADELIALEAGGIISRKEIPGRRLDAGLLKEFGCTCPQLPYQEIRPEKPDFAKDDTPLVLEDLTVKRGDRAVLDGLDACFRRGRIHAILGRSGCGKSTLFQTLCRTEKYQGRILVEGKELRQLGRKELGGKLGFVFQSPQDQFVTDTVLEEIMLSLRSGKCGDMEAEAKRILKAIGLWKYRQLSPYMLSQGQQRRLGVAAILAYRCRVLVCDEPTYAQDRANVIAIMEELQRQVTERGMTLVFSTHDRLMAENYADSIYELREGKLYEIH